MRLKQKHAKDVMSLANFDEVDEEAVAQEPEWIEDTAEKAECGRWGHCTDVVLDWYEVVNGELVWSKKAFYNQCISCGAYKVVRNA